MRIILVALFILSGASAVYGQAGEDHSKHKHGHSKHSDTAKDKKPSLDHGSKWKMDTHTRKMFVSMSTRIHTEADTKELGRALNGDLEKLIQGCTMTGAAHDQLHVFLIPYMSAVKELSTSGTEQALHKVKHALHDYQNYFE